MLLQSLIYMCVCVTCRQVRRSHRLIQVEAGPHCGTQQCSAGNQQKSQTFPLDFMTVSCPLEGDSSTVKHTPEELHTEVYDFCRFGPSAGFEFLLLPCRQTCSTPASCSPAAGHLSRGHLSRGHLSSKLLSGSIRFGW